MNAIESNTAVLRLMGQAKRVKELVEDLEIEKARLRDERQRIREEAQDLLTAYAEPDQKPDVWGFILRCASKRA